MVCLIAKESEVSGTFEYTYLFQIEALFQNNTYWSYDNNLYSIVYNNSQIAVYDYQGVFLGVLNENTPGVQIIKEGSREFDQDSTLYCKKSQIWNAGLKEGVIEWSINALDGYEIKSFGLYKDLESGLVYLATEEYNIDGTIYVLYVQLKNIVPTTIVGLFDYDYIVDYRNVKTLEYYFLNYSETFNAFPLVNTGKGIPNTLKFLQTYYDQGYRIFLLTALSTVVAGILEWFNSHPDTTGISAYSQSSALTVPKSIYRLTPDNNLKFNLYANACILPYDYIYYIYDPYQLVNQTVLINIQQITQSTGKTFVPFPIENPSTLTTEQINSIISQIPTGNNSSILVSMITYTNHFYNLFNNTTPILGYPFYELFIYPNITNPESQIYFNNILYEVTVSQANLNTSYLWDVGYQYFGIENYSPSALNSMIIAYQIENNKLVNNLGEHNDTIIFNQVTRDVVDVTFGLSQFVFIDSQYKFIPVSIYYSNSEGQVFITDVPDPVYDPVVVKPIPAPTGPKKKAIALLELTGGYVTNDSAMQKTIMYYLTTTSKTFEPISIYNTGGNLNTTLNMLETYYNQGVRIFIGFSRSTIVSGVLDWFNSHPDAIGISTTSSANSLATVKKNIYRLQIVDSYILDSISVPLQNTISSSGKIYYMYTYGEQAAQEVLDILNSTYGASNIIGYPVLKDNSNLTQQDLINFFINTHTVSANDSVVVYLIDGDQRQIYVDYFFGELSIPANQYDILGVNFPSINFETTTLNNLYNVLTIENITKSYLWKAGLEYLGDTNFSSNSLNALYMATSFVNNQDVLSLYSYTSCLQFTQYNDCKFGSVASYIYRDGLFVYNFIYSVDPIYGQLYYTLV